MEVISYTEASLEEALPCFIYRLQVFTRFVHAVNKTGCNELVYLLEHRGKNLKRFLFTFFLPSLFLSLSVY